jgi:hypothetical protein
VQRRGRRPLGRAITTAQIPLKEDTMRFASHILAFLAAAAISGLTLGATIA